MGEIELPHLSKISARERKDSDVMNSLLDCMVSFLLRVVEFKQLQAVHFFY